MTLTEILNLLINNIRCNTGKYNSYHINQNYPMESTAVLNFTDITSLTVKL